MNHKSFSNLRFSATPEKKRFPRSLGSGKRTHLRKCPHQLMCLSANSPEAIGFGWFQPETIQKKKSLPR
jgi:hypothetical protein